MQRRGKQQQMPFPEFILALAGIIGGTGFLLTPVFIVRMVLKHREKIEAMKYPKPGAPGSPAVMDAIAELRQEMAQLRDTTTKFDMSFDAALARVEDRLETLERERGTVTTRAVDSPRVALSQEEPAVLVQRR
jgi:hypothetical protein